MKNKIPYIISALALTFILGYTANAQVTSQKIGNNPTSISTSAVLEIESTTKGVLFPRVTLQSITDVLTVPSPTDGLTVFNTNTAGTAPDNVSFGYYYWSASASKWVKLAVETPPIEFAKTVYVNATSPNLVTATIFDETNPPATNNNSLKTDVANLYIGIDGSTWTYDNANSTYKTYAVAPSTPFNLANLTTDAGNNKTGSIWRTGNLAIGINNPATNLHIQNALAATNTVNADAKVLRFSRPSTASLKWDNIAQFNLGSYSITSANAFTRLDLALTNGGDNTTLSNVMTWQANGNVGIGTTAPERVLHLFSPGSSTPLVETSNAAGQTSLDFRTGPTGNQQAWRLIGQGNSVGNDRRFDIWNQTVNSPGLSVMPDNKVGIGTTNPTAQFEVATTLTSAAIFRRGGASVNQSSNIYLQRTQNSDPKLNTAGSFDTKIIGRLIFSMANGTSYPEYGNSSIGSYYVAAQSTSNTGGGLTFNTVNSGTTIATERLRIEHNGNVGIGDYGASYSSTNIPGSKLEVDGSSTNKTAFNAAANSTIDFSKSNLAYTTLDPQPFILQNMKDGGTYTLAVQGTAAAVASFSGVNPIGTSFTFKSPNNGPTTSLRETIYTFIVMGTSVYVYMTAGINVLP